METAKDIDEYLTELLGPDNPRGQKFKKDFLSHWHPPQRIPSPLTPQEGQILEELMRPQQEDMVLFQGEGGGKGGSSVRGRAKKVCVCACTFSMYMYYNDQTISYQWHHNRACDLGMRTHVYEYVPLISSPRTLHRANHQSQLLPLQGSLKHLH